VFPESVNDWRGAWPKGTLIDNLQLANGGQPPPAGRNDTSKYLRVAFRHGGKGQVAYPGVKEKGQMREMCNVGFLDSHVEKTSRSRLLNNVNMWHPPRNQGWTTPAF
jgi:prepilin-type processing-associated H-X9-DG protein